MTKRVIQAEGPEFLQSEGLTPEPAVWEDGIRVDTKPGTFEWWYFDAHFEDGSTAVVTMLTKPLLHRTDPLTPSVRLLITLPDGRQLIETPLYSPEQFSASRERCDLHIGPNWARGDLRHYELHVETGDLAAHLVFDGVAPPWRPGAGLTYYDEAHTSYFGWLPSIPFGYVEGTLTYDGQTRAVKGTGYHDHNWGNTDLNHALSHWYWGRAHLGDFSLIFAQLVANKAYGHQQLPYFMLAQGDKLLTGKSQPLSLSTGEPQKHSSGKTYPRTLDFHWQAREGTVHLALRNPQIIEATSLLTLLPTWKRLLARLFVNPYYFRFNVELEMTLDLEGVRANEHGPAIYELMILH